MKQQSHLIPFGRVTDLMDVGGDRYGKDLKVDKPLDIEVIWELIILSKCKQLWGSVGCCFS